MIRIGLGPDAQQQLDVGIGALAGSTVMLLTVPWSVILTTFLNRSLLYFHSVHNPLFDF